MRGPHTRLPSVTRTLWIAQGRRLRAAHLFTKELAKGTNDPVWLLTERLHQLKYMLQHRPKPLAHALRQNGVTFEDFQMFRGVVQAPDIDQAVAALREIEIPAPSADAAGDYLTQEADAHAGDPLRHHRLPPWLVLYLASHKARTPAQAEQALLNIVFTQIPHMPPRTQPSLLVMTALALAKHALVAPMQRVLDVFLTIPIDHPRLHFNLLLQAVARLPKSPAAAKLAVQVLAIMTARGTRLSTRTYQILLADRFVTWQLAQLLRIQMLDQGFVSSAAHLESYVRVFSKSGVAGDATTYMEAIRAHEARRGSPNMPFSPHLGEADGSPHRANTKYMRVFGNDRSSAFDYLARLLGQQVQKNEAIGSTAPRTRLPAKGPPKTVDVFDWTTALSAAARDLSTSSKRLIGLFERTLDSSTFPPTVATYTVLLRGLIQRKSYADAAGIWDRIVKERLVLDRKAIGAGVKALTLAREPAEAFRVLEAFGAKPGSVAASPALVRRGPRLWKRMSAEMSPDHPVQLDTMTMNDFMVALLRIDRPDAVFRLWDYMEVLYNVKPDSHSLDTLCRAARQAVKIDSNTFKGNIAMLGLSNPFLQPKAEPATREEMVRAMHAALSDHDHRKARSIWKGAPACDGVRTVFRELILGNWPAMRDVRAPAHAVRRPAEDDGPFAPFREVAQSISQSVSSPSRHPQGQPQAARHTPPLLSLLPSARHASVVPSDDAFQAYILLQGTSSCQHEIALTLAWMRALQVEPTRRTLCFALIFWAEVSVRGPLFEEWAVKNGTSEYGRLVEWIADWVGAAKAPNDGMVAAYLQEVAQAKDTSPTRKTLRIRRSTGREGER